MGQESMGHLHLPKVYYELDQEFIQLTESVQVSATASSHYKNQAAEKSNMKGTPIQSSKYF